MRTNSILIVDDDEKLCALLKSYFEQEQFIVYIAHDGMTALHTLRNQKPQIMLLDFDNEAPCVKPKGRSKERSSYQEAVNSLIIDIDTYLTKINNRKDTMKFSDDYLI